MVETGGEGAVAKLTPRALSVARKIGVKANSPGSSNDTPVDAEKACNQLK